MKKIAFIFNLKKIILSTLIAINLSSCVTLFSKNVNVVLDNEYKEITLINNDVEYVSSLYLSISGKKINDEIKIILTNGEDEKYFRREIIISNENNKYIYHSDYYTNVAILKIYSENNINGELKIKYYFSSY